MNKLYFPNPIILQCLQAGPLGGHIDAFVKHLSNEGYAVWTIKYSMRLLADLTTWMQQQQVVITALAEQPVNTFFQQRYQTLLPHRDDRAILVKLLTYLRMTGIIVEPIKVVNNPAIDYMLQEFQQHLIDQRNLAPITIQTYLGTVEHFLMHCYAVKPLTLDTLTVPEITDFMLQQARHYSAGHTQLIASGLRNFFRFLLQQGVTKINLAQCVLAPARRQLSTLPKFMKADDVELLLQSVDQQTPTGRRNFAILQLLARLGLRSGEVASLTLDDINWDEGIITVGGKGGHKDQLPLPQEVGQAIANYLCNGRPSCSTRHVFVRLRAPLRGYFSLRLAMGFKLSEAQRLLPRFIDFLEHQKAEFITTDLAVKWATESHTVQPAEWAKYLSLVRVFSRFCSSIDPRTEIPPIRLLPFHPHRASPYIYSDIEIKQLLQVAGQLPSPTGLRAHTYATVFGLLAVTGMRISELVSLENKDVNIDQAELTIRDTKFGKSRWLPLHPTTQQILHRYVLKRDHQYPIPYSPRFFVSETGAGLVSCTVRATFIKLSRKIGLRGITDSHGPRLHDFRHRFAVQTLLRWYQDGADVDQHLPELSTYLGHVKVSDTYWYLTVTPELLQLALQRSEQGLQEERA